MHSETLYNSRRCTLRSSSIDHGAPLTTCNSGSSSPDLCQEPSTQQPHGLSHTQPAAPRPSKTSLLKQDISKSHLSQDYLSQPNSLPKLIAVCAIIVFSVAPCQCISPAGTCTTSPTISFRGVSPFEQTKPVPIVTVRIWPRSCVCQKVRAPGVKHTLLPMQLPSSAVKIGSMCTVPVKVSVGCLEGVLGLWAARISCMVDDGVGVY
jgi:hypothetical protein